MTKCSHDLCRNEAEPGSEYCGKCIQLPTKECSSCNSDNMTEVRKINGEIQKMIRLNRLYFYIEVAVVVIIGLTLLYLLISP